MRWLEIKTTHDCLIMAICRCMLDNASGLPLSYACACMAEGSRRLFERLVAVTYVFACTNSPIDCDKDMQSDLSL